MDKLFGGIKKSYKIILLFIIIISTILASCYLLSVILLLGKNYTSVLFKLFINVLMYYSIIKYIINYFQQGKQITIESMLLRYSISLVSILLDYSGKNNLIFYLLAFGLILISYMAGSMQKVKQSLVVFIIVLLITLFLAMYKIYSAPKNYIYGFGPLFYYVDAFNQTIEWLIFMFLYVLRYKVELDNINKKQK